jgi:uncharacterized membrane protein
MKKWSVFAAAVIFVGYLLISRGAPPVPVLCGLGLAGLLTMRRTQSA